MNILSYLSIIAVGAYASALLFLTFAIPCASRPSRVKRRVCEFGLYFLIYAALTAFSVPSASVVLHNGYNPPELSPWSIIRTLTSAVAVARSAYLILSWYGQRVALEEHIKKLEAQLSERPEKSPEAK